MKTAPETIAVHTRPSSRCGSLRVALALSIAAVSGCVQRTVHVTSQPSGALVYLNDEEVGRTPVTVPFTFYGVYDVRLEKDGYHPLWTATRADAPWWEAPGPDLIAETIPGLKVKLDWHYQLRPLSTEDEDSLISRAQELHDSTRTDHPSP